MGDAVAPFLSSDIFLGNLEKQFSTTAWFPHIWFRYIDDIFAILPENNADMVLENLNSSNSSIRFTMEKEMDGTIPFLDVLIKRVDTGLSFDVYRKPTSTDRYITSDSYHSHQHKLAAFNSMVHRMVNLPLSTEAFNRESDNIKRIAHLNGYDSSVIGNIIIRHKRKTLMRDATRLVPLETKLPLKRIKVPFHPPLTAKLKNIFKKANCVPVFSSSLKVANLLCNNKDPSEMFQKSGIYCIKCNSCSYVYIGQSRRAIDVRWCEHNKHIAKNEPTKSSVALHYLENLDHELHKENFNLLKTVREPYKLDLWESLFMHKHSYHLMNTQPAPSYSPLFNLL